MNMKDFLGVLLLAVLWSPTFLLVKFGLDGFPPLTLTFLRCAVAVGCLLIISFRRGPLFPFLKKKWKDLAIAGLIGNALPFALCAYGEVRVTSALAGIIEGMVPLFTLLLARIFPPFLSLKWHQFAGVVIGFSGILCIFLPGMWDPSQADQMMKDIWGEVALAGMALSFAVSFIFAKERLSQDSPIEVMTGQMLFASLWIFPLTLFETPVTPTPEAVQAIVILGIFCTTLPWLFHYYLLRYLRAADIALAAYFIPIGSIGLGYCFLEEILILNDALGAGMILIAMALAGGLIKISSRFSALTHRV